MKMMECRYKTIVQCDRKFVCDVFTIKIKCRQILGVINFLSKLIQKFLLVFFLLIHIEIFTHF